MSERRRSTRLNKNEETPVKEADKKAPAPATPTPQKKTVAAVAVMEVDNSAELAKEAAMLFLADLKASVQLVEKAVALQEKRFAIRALRTLPSLRKRWSPVLLGQAVEAHLPKESQPMLLSLLGVAATATAAASGMDVDEAAPVKSAAVELDVYFRLLVTIVLLDQKQVEKALAFAQSTVNLIQAANRRTLDTIASHVYFYYARCFELLGKLQDVRPFLLSAHRTATLRHDEESQTTLINLLLRNYLHYNLYEQAEKLAAKLKFPTGAGNSQVARFMYYIGRIKAVQLDYTAANRHLLQAVRKAPQTGTASGFLQTVQKLSIIVQLLMGEIPERSVFRQAALIKALVPYFHITQAVRIGDLQKFQDTLGKYGAQFKADKTYTLILRLRHNVIKTGIRMISLSYSRISLKDICIKLHLDSEESAEFIVAKAIRDGVIDAAIDHEHAFMKSKENTDVYASAEPQQAFHQRIQYCLNMHNESVKAMRYPRKPTQENSEVTKELQELEREMAELAEEEDDMDMDDEGDF